MTSRTLYRRTDPATSREAAEKFAPRRLTVRAAVHLVLTEHGPLTHDDLVKVYGREAAERADWPLATASSIRTRCKELTRDGLVERVPDAEGRSRYGNRAAVWRAAGVYSGETVVHGSVDA